MAPTRITGRFAPLPSAPAWFCAALAHPLTSNFVAVDGCPIHYLVWPHLGDRADPRGLLFVHGGGAHANWWRFIAPFFTRDFRVAALDLSGMGDSGQRDDYNAIQRADEMKSVIAAAGLGTQPFVVGHSFGGFMTMRFGAAYGEQIGGAVIVDSPIRRPEDRGKFKPPKGMGRVRVYDSFDTAVGRFRLLPAQDCANDFIVDFIARHSVKEIEGGWTWKFDLGVLSSRRFGEPFHEHLQKVRCRAALLFGQDSALVSRDTAAYMSELMGPGAPIVEIPEAQHHVMLDQPLAFVAALRALLDGWLRDGVG
jgi:pimeloyl-ACP methyl ester carboxylesterase